MSIAVRLAQKAAGRSGAFNMAQGVAAIASLRGGQAPATAVKRDPKSATNFNHDMR